MALKRAVLAGFRGHSPRWFEFHGSMIEIVAIAGPVRQHAQERMKQFGFQGKQYDDPAEMIRKEDAEIALIWTPKTEDHVPLGLAALDRGMDVMLEKPLSEDPAEALRFVEQAEAAGKVAMVMQNIRWQNAAMEVKEAIDQDKIGQLFWLEVAMRGLFNGFIYEGIHVTDLARYWYEQRAQWVHGVAAEPEHRRFDDDLMALTVGFEGGGVARVVLDWASVGHQHWIKARLEGSKAALAVTWGEPIEVQGRDQEKVQIPKWTTECNDMKKLLAHFLECIDTGKTPINNARDQLQTLDIIFAARESARSRQVVKLPFQFTY